MREYRVTKYDPKNRNHLGYYILDEWTSIHDIGRTFDGKVLTEEDYLNVENKYIDAVTYFMECCSVKELTISWLEQRDADYDRLLTTSMKKMHKNAKNGIVVDNVGISDIIKLNLREDMWCQLVSDKMFVHFGYDYYMYIGADGDCVGAIKKIEEAGLFVEEFSSPYH